VAKDTPRLWILADGTSLSFDGSIREMHSSDLTITDEPVETGVVVSDHAFMAPAQFEMDGRVTTSQVHPTIGDPFGVGDSRADAAWAYLKNLQKSATPFQIQTGLQLYQNMVIKSLSAVQDKDSSSVLDFHAILREVIQVSTQNVTFPPRKPKKPSRTASPKVSAGEKSPDPVTTPQQTSLLLQGLFAGGIVTPDQIKAAAGPMAASQAGQ
jgi:hypothetical protein